MTDKPSEGISGLDRLRSGAMDLLEGSKRSPETPAERDQRIRNSGNPLLQTSASYAAERERIRQEREDRLINHGTTAARPAPRTDEPTGGGSLSGGQLSATTQNVVNQRNAAMCERMKAEGDRRAERVCAAVRPTKGPGM
jgi:hypothetical protein